MDCGTVSGRESSRLSHGTLQENIGAATSCDTNMVSHITSAAEPGFQVPGAREISVILPMAPSNDLEWHNLGHHMVLDCIDEEDGDDDAAANYHDCVRFPLSLS
jgi:hypothetical protein